MSGMPVASQFGAVYAAGWLITKFQDRKRKIWFHDNSAYTLKEHVEYLTEMFAALIEDLPELVEKAGVDPKRIEETRRWLETPWWYAEGFEIPDLPEDDLYGQVMVDTIVDGGRWLYDFGVLLGKKARDEVEAWIRRHCGEHLLELLHMGAYTTPYENTNTTYAGYFPHHKAWLLARAVTMGMGEAWEKEIEAAKIKPQLTDIFRRMNLAYYRRQLEASPVPKEEWEPMVERLEKLYKEEPFPFHRGSELRAMLSEAIEKKYFDYVKDAVWE